MKKINLNILVDEKSVLVEFGGKKINSSLKKRPILNSINSVVKEIKNISEIVIEFNKASFSNTRQAVAVVNTLAWQLGIKVNGKKQIKAEYSRELNIT